MRATRVATLIVTIVLMGCGGHPSDHDMIAFFGEHRSEFIELRDIALADYSLGITRLERKDLDIDWQKNPPEFPTSSDLSVVMEDRKQSYRDLMDRLGIEQLQIWPAGVDFLVSRKGIAVSGSGKSYVWTDEPTFGPVVASLEDPLPSDGFVTKTWFNGYRLIEADWYLHYSAE